MSENYSWMREQAESFWDYPIKGRTFRKASWLGDDHAHCLFCAKEISNYSYDYETDKQGYVSTDEMWWACSECFEEFSKIHAVPLLKNTVQMIRDAIEKDKTVIVSLNNEQYFIKKEGAGILVEHGEEVKKYTCFDSILKYQSFYGGKLEELIDKIYLGFN